MATLQSNQEDAGSPRSEASHADVPGLIDESLNLLDQVIALTAAQIAQSADPSWIVGQHASVDQPPVLIQLLAIGRIQYELDRQITSEARRAVRERRSYTEIGDALGISKQRAHQRFRRA